MGNKRKIKVVAGYWINDLRGYFCCTDILLMSMCRIAVLNNHLQCVLRVSSRCHGPDFISSWSSSEVLHWIREKLSRHVVLQDQPWQQRDERVWTDDSIKTEIKLFSASVLLLPSHTDSTPRQRIQYWMSSQTRTRAGIWGLSCYAALSWFDHYGNM